MTTLRDLTIRGATRGRTWFTTTRSHQTAGKPPDLVDRTDDELEAALDALTASEGLSRREVIRRVVLERHERAGHRRRVGEAAERMVDRWGDVLDRPGSV